MKTDKSNLCDNDGDNCDGQDIKERFNVTSGFFGWSTGFINNMLENAKNANKKFKSKTKFKIWQSFKLSDLGPLMREIYEKRPS